MQPTEAGIVPVNLFLDTSSLVNFDNRPTDDGKVPDRLLEDIMRVTKSDMLPMEEEMVPVSPLLNKYIEVTADPLHVTPVQAGEHTLLRGVLPEQRHPVRPDKVHRFVATQRSHIAES